MKSGIVPLWNPYISCGVPHLALQQSVVFYPLSLLYYILPFDLGFNVFLIAHIFLAGLFTYMLSRRWGYCESASFFTAISFMFGGYMVSVINLATTLSSVIWLPLILYFFDRALAEQRRLPLSLSAVFLGIMFLGGEPSIFYSTVWVLFFYSVFYWLNGKNLVLFKKCAFTFLAAVLAGVLLSAIQLFPFAELMRHSDRVIGAAPYEELTRWSLPVKDTLSFLVPFITRTDFSKESYWKEQNWVMLIYAGALAAILLPLCLVLKKPWRTKFLLFIGLLFLFISYGGHTPFYYFVYKIIPGFRFVRYPVRFLYVTSFAIAMLCGAGFNGYMRLKDKDDPYLKNFLKYALVASYLFAVIFLALNMYRNDFINGIFRFCTSRYGGAGDTGILMSYIIGMVNIKRFLGFIIAGTMVLFLGSKLKLKNGIIAFSFISLVVADLFSALPSGQLTLSYKTLHAPAPNTELLSKDKTLFRFFASPKTREHGYFLEGQTYEEAIRQAKNGLSANWPMIYGLYDVYGYDSIWLADYAKFLCLVDTSGSPDATRLLDMVGAKYLLLIDKANSQGYRLLTENSVYLYESKSSLPRAFFADSFKVLKDEQAVAERFKSKEFDPLKEVILREEPILKSQQSIVNGRWPKKEFVEITKYSPNEVIIKARLNSQKFLVLSDSYYPGWNVYVNGEKRKIYAANYILRALPLEPGSHSVKFLFEPASFKLGLAVSGLTLLILIILAIV